MQRRVMVHVGVLVLAVVPGLASAGAWYAGDLHAHSLHSDGDSSVGALITKAESLGLDYFVITDHDSSMNGETPHWSDPEYQSDQLILLYGIEWTTGKGHANLWAAAPFDYTQIWKANLLDDPWMAAESAHAQGALFSINHPTNYTCCSWRPEDGMNDAVEVWNGTHRTVTWDYGATHNFWQNSLLQGQRMTAVGGSDVHYLNGKSSGIYSVGNPTTWVYADSPTRQGILDGIKAGRVSISYAPDAPRVELWADADSNGSFETLTGGSLPAGNRSLQVRIGDAAGKVTPVPVQDVATYFSHALTPGELLRLGSSLAPSACGNTYLVGVYEKDTLLKSAYMACGGTWTLPVTAVSGNLYRVEVLGNTQTPRNQPTYGSYIGMTNAIFVP